MKLLAILAGLLLSAGAGLGQETGGSDNLDPSAGSPPPLGIALPEPVDQPSSRSDDIAEVESQSLGSKDAALVGEELSPPRRSQGALGESFVLANAAYEQGSYAQAIE